MSESWDSLTGGIIPRGSSDVKNGLHKAIQDKSIRYNKKEDGDLKSLSQRVWEEAGEDANVLIEAFDATLRKRANIAYLFACLSRGQFSPPQSQGNCTPTEAQIPPEIKKQDRSTDKELDRREKTFVKIYRSIRHHPWFKGKPAWVKLFFIELCLDAAYKDHDVIWKNYKVPAIKVHLRRGQYIIRERDIAKEYDQSPRMVHYWLNKLESEGMILRQNVKYFGENRVALDVALNVALGVAVGTLVTICKYDDYQGSKNDDVALDVALDVAYTKECIQKKEKQKNGIQDLPGCSQNNKITKEEIFNIWEKERGPLSAVAVRQAQNIDALREHLNTLVGATPQEHWQGIVHKARQCHASHYPLMSPAFFSKDLEHINQLLRGVYDRSFERKGHGKPTITERPGRGNAEEFGAEAGKGAARVKRLADAFKSSDV